MRNLPCFDKITLIGIGYVASSVAALIGKYRRLDGKLQFNKDEEYTLKNIEHFVDSIKKGFEEVQTFSFSMNPFYSAAYNCYTNVRLRLPSIDAPQTVDGIKNEIIEFKTVLGKLEKISMIENIGKEKLNKLRLFFSTLGEMTLEDLYILNENEEFESTRAFA